MVIMAKDEVPRCHVCGGRNWVDLGTAGHETDDRGYLIEITGKMPHLFQCGGLPAHGDPNDKMAGCMRVIRATPADMKAGGMI